MKMQEGYNYQPVMIRTLNQNNGKATKEKIIEDLHDANPEKSKDDFNDSVVFRVLINHNVIKYDENDKMYFLLDYETYSPAEKAHITMSCDEKIKNPFNLKINVLNIKELTNKFLEWLNSEKIIESKREIEKEKIEVKELMKKLETLDKSSPEFVELVLYGLLPYGKTKYAKRISRFPVFLNIKTFLKDYEYTEEDWKNIANRIYSLAYNFQKKPDKIKEWIDEFTSDKKYNRMLQCGSISPILFCINDSYPVINNKIIRTYRDFSRAFNWEDKMSQKIGDYIQNLEKCKKLIDFLQIDEVKDLTNFDEFCWWYDDVQKEEADEKIADDEEDEPSKVEIQDIEFGEFLSNLNLDDRKKFEPHALRNPERIRIREIIQNTSKGRWQLPNFQRYFDWTKTDIRDLLESIFRDYYIGAFLMWENEAKPQLKIMPIEGVSVNDDMRTDMIILDGQQRITSLYYAIRPSGKSTKKIRKPVYFYINFEKFLRGIEEGTIEVLEEKLSKEESIQKLLFPIYEIEKFDEWIDAFEDTIGIPSSESYAKLKDVRRVIEKKVKHFIDGFEIPYVSLPSTMELNQVTDIFERINTKGKTLTVFDLLIATLNLYDIDLRRLWDDAERNYPKLKSYNSRDKLPIYVLQSMALSYHPLSQCSRQDILGIYKNVFQSLDIPFEDAWEETVQYVNKAILKLENLRDGYGVKNRKALPYLPTIPILASLLKEIDGYENKIDCLSKLNKWYWTSIFSEHYSSGVDAKLSADFREMQEWFKGKIKVSKVVENFHRKFGTALNLKEIKRENNAIFRGILSLLSLEGAPDFNTNLTLENAPNNDKHHIFPKDSFKKHESINSVLNMTWLSDDTNRKIIRAQKPSVYIKKFIDEKYNGDITKFQNNISKHFINEKAYQYLINDELTEFLGEREKILREKIANIVGMKQSDNSGTLLSPKTPFDNEMIVEETFQKCDEYVHWVDKFFRVKGLKWLSRYLPKENIKEIKILTSIDTATEELRDMFKAFKKQMSNDNISCQMQVIVDNKLKGSIHGRWLITRNDCFSFQSVDTVSRGSYDDIRGGATKPPFDEWWKNSLDIIEDWTKIQEQN
jgi:hypothetical protein